MVASDVTEAAPAPVRGLAVSLLDGFSFRSGGEALPLPSGPRKVLAFLALRDGPATRRQVAAALWPDASPQDAAGSLRSSLWRLKPVARAAVVVEDLDLALHRCVVVDIRAARTRAARLLDPTCALRAEDQTAAAVVSLSNDLLPGWADPWAAAERAEWHQVRLHALEAMASRLVGSGRWAEAVIAALAAIRAEPLRESAHAAVIKVFLAEGNQMEALESYEHYRTTLRSRLGIEPSAHLASLVEGIARQRAAT